MSSMQSQFNNYFFNLTLLHQEINREMLRSFRVRNVSLTILFLCAITMKGKWR
jgi:hypothetical protein